MTTDQKQICLSLGKVSYLPASFDKRFGYNLHSLAIHDPEKELSEAQNEWMYRLLYKYRKQLPETYNRFKDNPFCSRLEKRTKV
jgi:hypothetical protein